MYMTNDRQLIRGCINGNENAQKQLYEQFAPQMMAVCYRYTKSQPDAEDALQMGFVRVFKFIDQYKFQGELGAWILRIIVNTTLNYLKQHKRYQNEMVFTGGEMHVVAADDPNMDLRLKELLLLVRQLPTGYQTIFNLYAVEGYSHPEIGQMLGISDATSRSQYMRARNLLITWLSNNAGNKQLAYAK